jgi:hypothetical protein
MRDAGAKGQKGKEQRAKSKGQRAKSKEQRAKSKGQRAKSKGQRAKGRQKTLVRQSALGPLRLALCSLLDAHKTAHYTFAQYLVDWV